MDKILAKTPAALLFILHFLFLLLIYVIYSALHHRHFLPALSFLHNYYDVMHYNTIRLQGYTWHADRQSNVAFFPGFPYFWKWSHLNGFGIAFINLILFGLSMWLFQAAYKLKKTYLLFYLSIPSILFFYIPYSESVFFFFCTLFIIGLKKENLYLSICGILLASVTRSAANIFIPALILMMVYYQRAFLKKGSILLLASLAGVLFVAYMQYLQTNQWFGFISTQRYWNHSLQWIKLPMRSWGKNAWYDGIALFFGVIAIIATIRLLFDRLIGKQYKVSPELLFSLLYICGVTALSILLNGGEIYSLNRYIFPTVFFVVAAQAYFEKIKWRPHPLVIFLIIFIFLIPFHLFVHIQQVIKYLFVSIYGMLFIWQFSNRNSDKIVFWMFYLVNCYLQVYFLAELLTGEWIG